MQQALDIDRRQFLAAGAAGLFLPSRRLRAAAAEGFTHGVASGEPGARSMLFWTRFAAAGDRPVELRLELSTDPRMARSRVLGEALAEAGRDWTARAMVGGLSPATTYYYRWIGPGKNVRSPIGRTRTLPEEAATFRLGVFSCSNLPYGWFNAYAQAVAADDIDLAVHLGDYLYEYPRGTYPDAASAVPGRVIEPAGATVRREEYWARYASYRLDPDLLALHARVPFIAMWDDHEIANDAWARGAENHDPRTEGSWSARLAAALAAWRDWMPVSEEAWASYDIGRLATLFRLDTRISGRDEQLNVAAAIKAGPDTMTALKRLRDEQWLAGNRQLLGPRQEQWLFRAMEAARRRGARWQVIAQQVIMGQLMTPPGAAALAGPKPDPQLAAFLGAATVSARVGLPLNLDAWDGYPAARARLLSTAQRLAVDLVVLAGDSHNAWGNDLVVEGRPAGVEFAVSSVSSPGFETYLRSAPPAAVAGALMEANPHLRFADTAQRGWLHLTLSQAMAEGQWRFTESVRQRSARLAGSRTARVQAGQRRLTLV